MTAGSSSRKVRIDASFLNPQAISRRSWLMRLPFLGRLADVKAWWNPLWIEEFELVTPHRPAVVASMLDERLPSVPGLALWDLAGWRAAGYVWSGGFSLYRVTVSGNGFRALGTGIVTPEPPVTRIRLRVAIGRWTAYALLLFYFVWGLFGALALVRSVGTFFEGRFNVVLLVIALGLLIGPLVLFALLAGRGDQKTPGSRESEFILAFLRDAIGAEVR